MPTNVIMPALELAQESGKVLRWLKAPGDRVQKGDPLVEIETDKITTEIEAPESGILRDVTAQEGAVIPVGQTIAVIGEAVGAVVAAAGGRGTAAAAPAGARPAPRQRWRAVASSSETAGTAGRPDRLGPRPRRRPLPGSSPSSTASTSPRSRQPEARSRRPTCSPTSKARSQLPPATG